MFDRNLMRQPGMRGVMGGLIVLALLQSACIIGESLMLADAISILWTGCSLDEALPAIVAFIGCFSLLHLIRFAEETMLERYSEARARAIRSELLERVFDERTLLARKLGAAHVTTLATEGIDEVQTYLRIIPPKVVGLAAVSFPLLVCAFVIDWPSGIILAVMFPVTVFYLMLLGKQARERSERQYATYTRLSRRFMDTLRGLPVIKSFGVTREEETAVFEQSESLRKATMRTLTMATLSSAVLDFCATFGVAAVAMMLAFRLMDGSVALTTGLAALILSPEYFAPIRSFASDFHASLDGKNALADLLAACDETTEDGMHPQEAADVFIDDTALDELSFTEVAYLYDDSGAGIQGIHFTVHAHERIGIIGPSGSGKSTLANLLAGFTTPTSGSINVNGIPADLTSHAWKRHVRYIPQSPYIFRLSLADNIRFYRPDAPIEKVMEAVRAVGLEALVDELPYGLDTVIGEGARGLSGGEAHRIALARIFLDDNAHVLVFDEPTAHLDIETELELKEPMLALMSGKLVFFATHRLHWLSDMDRIIELGTMPIPLPDRVEGSVQ